MPDFDAVVIGGGPAGLAAALAARRAGLSVLVADVRNPPIDKLCGEGLLPDTLDALDTLGVDLGPATGQAFGGISFHGGQQQFAAEFPGRTGLGVRRVSLHDALVRAVGKVGVGVRWGVRAERIASGQVRVGKDKVSCRYIIGADGHRSLARRGAGLDARTGTGAGLRACQRLGSGCHYAVAPWSRFVEVHWARNVQAYVTPVGENEVSVAILCQDRQVHAEEALRLFPALGARLAGAERLGREQGSTSHMLRLPRVVRDEVLLIGDASGSVDAITGEGLSLAFRQALALGEALRTGNPAAYEKAHRVLLRPPRMMARLLLLLSNHPTLRHCVFQGFTDKPRVFERLLRLHLGSTRRQTQSRPTLTRALEL